MSVLIFVWWFAAVSPNGEIVVFEYRTEQACSIIRGAYARAGVNVTTCQHKEGEPMRTTQERARLDAAQIHDVLISLGWEDEHAYHAVVLWEPLDDGGTYTAEILAIFYDEWCPEDRLEESARWSFWYDWQRGYVKLQI